MSTLLNHFNKMITFYDACFIINKNNSSSGEHILVENMLFIYFS